MLTFSKREEYGIAVVTRLAKGFGQKPLSLSIIAREEGITLPFLRQIALDLRQAGLLRASEGKNGGYQLAKNPKEISLADVIEAVVRRKLLYCCNPRG
jgi:Rrf2 family protein